MTRKNTFQTNEFNGPKGGAKTDIEWISKEEWVDLVWVWYRTWAILCCIVFRNSKAVTLVPKQTGIKKTAERKAC